MTLFLIGQDGFLLVKVNVYVRICRRGISLAVELRYSVCPLDPSLCSCWHLDIQTPVATAPVQLLVETPRPMPLSLTHTHAHKDSPYPNIWLPMLFSVEIHRCSHDAELSFGDLYIPLAPRPLHLLASSSGLIFTSHHTLTHPCSLKLLTPQTPVHTDTHEAEIPLLENRWRWSLIRK